MNHFSINAFGNETEQNQMLPVSVIIPVYNAEEFLNETINSVLNQTFGDFELIIADDMSTDRTKEIVMSYTDPRIRYVFYKHDFIATRNRSLRLAQGKYIAQLDHDDLMLPERLQIQYDFMESHTDIAACGGFMQRFGKHTGVWQKPLDPDELLLATVVATPILNPTGFIRREILTKHKIMHKRGYSTAEDFKFWTDIAKAGKLANIPEVLVLYRTSDNQASALYYSDMVKASYAIQFEMVDWFLSRLDKNSALGKMVFRKLMPSMENIINRGCLSWESYFNFMYCFIGGLKSNSEISFYS